MGLIISDHISLKHCILTSPCSPLAPRQQKCNFLKLFQPLFDNLLAILGQSPAVLPVSNRHTIIYLLQKTTNSEVGVADLPEESRTVFCCMLVFVSGLLRRAKFRSPAALLKALHSYPPHHGKKKCNFLKSVISATFWQFACNFGPITCRFTCF